MSATTKDKLESQSERFNFWCKVCGGVVHGLPSDHGHKKAAQK